MGLLRKTGVQVKRGMEYSLLGNTGIRVPRLWFGTAPLGGLYGKQRDQSGTLARELVHTAVRNGIRAFDTSPFYGNAEEVLGKALDGLVREDIILCSKGGRISDTEFDFSVAGIEASLQRSLDRLGVTYLDIYLLHDVEFGNLYQIMTETLPYLAKQKQEGRICAIGFSCYPLATVFHALGYLTANLLDVVLVYGHHNLYQDDLGELADELKTTGIGLLDASPYLMGLLSDRGPPEWHPAGREAREKAQQLSLEVMKRGVPLSHLALRYALETPVGAGLVVGIRDIVELMDNLNVYMCVKGIGDVGYVGVGATMDFRQEDIVNYAKEQLKSLRLEL